MRPRPSLYDRLMAKFEVTPDGCWTWTACRQRLGYGMIQVDGRARYAHRVAYELLVGPIPAGLSLDHLCRNRACVNPEHLEPVTHRENVMRGVSFAVTNAAKTVCLRGHELNAENVYIKADGARQCKPCMALSRARYEARRRVERGGEGYAERAYGLRYSR